MKSWYRCIYKKEKKILEIMGSFDVKNCLSPLNWLLPIFLFFFFFLIASWLRESGVDLGFYFQA